MPIKESDLLRSGGLDYIPATQPGPGRRAIVNQPDPFQALNTALNPFTRPSAPDVYIPTHAAHELSDIRFRVLVERPLRGAK